MPLSAALPVVTFRVPVNDPAAISPTSPVTTSAAEPATVTAVFSASAVAVPAPVSVLKLSVIEVGAEPVVIAIVLSVASPVVTVSAPVSELAVILPIRPLTTSAEDPTSVSTVLLASVVASTVTVSPVPFAVIEVAAEPVVIDMPLSAASPVVTVSAPVSDPAAISPTSPLTTSAEDPASVSAVLLASAVAFAVTVSPVPFAVIEVAAEPVVIDMPLSAASPVVTFRVPVKDPTVISPTNPVTTSAADPVSVNAVFCAREAAFTVTTSPAPLALIYVAADPV